ncbi:MAG TPA: ribonuclease Y [Actinomycetota bacterium]|jgi:ribonucrease Y|nr:ribonuclease Y [Actinomycetota bacterium]
MEILIGLLGLLAGVAAGYALRKSQAEKQVGSAEQRSKALLEEAEREAEAARREALVEAKDEIFKMRQQAESDLRDAEAEIRERRADINKKEDRLAQREATLDSRASSLDRKEQAIEQREEALERRSAELQRLESETRAELERVAGMAAADAKQMLIEQMSDEAKRDAMVLVRDIEAQAREEADKRARKIVGIAMQRVASELTTEATVTTVTLPNEDMKGRIIGREGRNIRAFEAATGTNLIIDDTPEAVVLSCFDPIRRETARLTLEKLIGDGRIQPARIEDIHEKSKQEIEREIREAGEWAVLETGITDMHPELVRVLGRLKYRTSYGQQVLKHVVEAAHIAGAIAAELGTDVQLARRCTLLHDIGKAVTHEIEGSHAIIGAEIARRLKESPEVCHAIEAHHGEVEQRTIEAVITQVADAISGARPGARRETLETYVKRLERLEQIANEFSGVDKVYAMQAGREVRVMVRPDKVDDLQAEVVARDIAKKIEEELQYPGQIKVMVIRELRTSATAK